MLLLLDDDGGHAEPDRLLGRQIVLAQQQRLLDAFASGDLELIHRPDNVAALTVRVNRDTLIRLGDHRLVIEAGRDTMDLAYINGRHSDATARELQEYSLFVLTDVVAPPDGPLDPPPDKVGPALRPGDVGCALDLVEFDAEQRAAMNRARETFLGSTAQAGGPSSTLDVLVVYTPLTRDVVGGLTQVNQVIQDAVAQTNRAFDNSQIDAQLRLVGSGEVNYTHSGSIFTDLNSLRVSGDFILDEVHGWRDCAGADLVSLLIGVPTGSLGVGNVFREDPAFAFTVVEVQVAVSLQIFSHELGHNFGCGHHRTVPGDCPFAFFPEDGCGHVFTVGAETFRTINVSGTSPHIEHYSNPSVSFPASAPNAPTGVDFDDDPANAANNARTVNITRSSVAGFRATVADPAPCTPPQLIRVVKGLGPNEHNFISPHDEFCAYDSFEVELTEAVTLVSGAVASSGSPLPHLVSVTHVGGGIHIVQLSRGIPVGHWTTIRLDVRSVATSIVWSLPIKVGHLPVDVNQSGTVNITDSTAFGAEFNGLKRPELIDINCDGLVDIRDATAFGVNFNGLDDHQVWNGQNLPPFP